MQIHLYMTFDNFNDIQQDKSSYGWLKEEKHTNDVHVSFNTKEYLIERTDNPKFFRVIKKN